MPIYEYSCTQCGNVEEIFQKITDRPISKCSQCSGKLHKLISQSTFHLKGSGWYVTDYANKSGSPSPSPKKEAKTPSKTNSDTSTKNKKKKSSET
jgi:putative FmdB family regulatory protein